MNRSVILDFLKAPFKERFVLACILGLPILLATPVIFSFFKFIYTHIDTFQKIESEENIDTLLYSWFITQDTFPFICAASGMIVAFILIYGFMYTLGHEIVKQRGKVFEFKPLSITSGQIIMGVLKAISYTFWGIVYGFLCILTILLLPFLTLIIGGYLPGFLTVLLWLIVVLIDVVFVIWAILNTWVANFRFLIHFKTRVFFQVRENYLYLKQYKGNFFLAWALCWVCGMIISVLLKTFYSWIIYVESFLEGLLLQLNVPYINVVVALGLLVAVIITIYLSLLKTTFMAKSIVWMEQKHPHKKNK